jgi:hypothetical protein
MGGGNAPVEVFGAIITNIPLILLRDARPERPCSGERANIQQSLRGALRSCDFANKLNFQASSGALCISSRQPPSERGAVQDLGSVRDDNFDLPWDFLRGEKMSCAQNDFGLTCSNRNLEFVSGCRQYHKML